MATHQFGLWLTLIGSVLAVFQSVWVIFSTLLKRRRLRREFLGVKALKGASERNRARQIKLEEQLTETSLGESEQSALTIELESLKEEEQRLSGEISTSGWVYTWAHLHNELTPVARELKELDDDWSRMWTLGAPGLAGGVLALLGTVLITMST